MRPLLAIVLLSSLLSLAPGVLPAAAETAPTPDSLARGSSRVDSLLRDAKRYIGTRYRYGASGETGFDCTGFTSFIFRKYGYTLERSSRGQAGQGTAVQRDSLLPGDLVVFSGRRISRNTAGHIGIVVSVDRATGDFTFIHACSRGVTISRFAAERYYVLRYLDARRILPLDAHQSPDFKPVLNETALVQPLFAEPELRPSPLAPVAVSPSPTRKRR